MVVGFSYRMVGVVFDAFLSICADQNISIQRNALSRLPGRGLWPQVGLWTAAHTGEAMAEAGEYRSLFF